MIALMPAHTPRIAGSSGPPIMLSTSRLCPFSWGNRTLSLLLFPSRGSGRVASAKRRRAARGNLPCRPTNPLTKPGEAPAEPLQNCCPHLVAVSRGRGRMIGCTVALDTGEIVAGAIRMHHAEIDPEARHADLRNDDPALPRQTRCDGLSNGDSCPPTEPWTASPSALGPRSANSRKCLRCLTAGALVRFRSIMLGSNEVNTTISRRARVIATLSRRQPPSRFKGPKSSTSCRRPAWSVRNRSQSE